MTSIVFGAPPAIAGSTAPSLCTSQESIWFSCPVARGRSIALCGTPGVLPQYRFGRSSAVEMRFPNKGVKGKMLFSRYVRYQTDRVEIRFINRGVDYILFDHVEDGFRRAGVRVTTADSAAHEIACMRPPTGRLAELEGLLACDPDSSLNGGVCR